MTLHQLNQYRKLRKEIPSLRRQIRELRGEDDTRAILESRIQRVASMRTGIEAYIASIDDSELRQIFDMRFKQGYSWQKVAMQLGGGNSAKGVSIKVYRYVKLLNL